MKNYSTLRRVLFILFIVSLLASNSYAFHQSISQQEFGKIKGTIFDELGARIIRAEIIAENEQHKFIVKVNEDGEFEQILSIGIYRVTISAPGFYPFTRKAVVINANSVISLDTTLTVSGAPSRCKSEDGFDLVDLSGKENYVGIIYAEKSEKGEIVEYKSGFLSTCGDIEVYVYYGQIHLIAEKVILNNRTLDLEAIGNVVITEGEKKRKLDHLILHWKKKVKSSRYGIIE